MNWLDSAYKKYGHELKDVSGAWTAKTAKEIDASVDARNYSQTNPNYQGKIISVLRGEFGGHPVR